MKTLRDIADSTLIIEYLYLCIRLTLDRQTFNKNLFINLLWQTK